MFTQNAWHYVPGATPDWPAEKIEKGIADGTFLGRCAVPEDIAHVVAFLASEDGGWVNGEPLLIFGWQMFASCANATLQGKLLPSLEVSPVNLRPYQ